LIRLPLRCSALPHGGGDGVGFGFGFGWLEGRARICRALRVLRSEIAG
jgi:hypothetical protein